nr:MAG TPA: UL95 family protein [Caudoviricetes sp.]
MQAGLARTTFATSIACSNAWSLVYTIVSPPFANNAAGAKTRRRDGKIIISKICLFCNTYSANRKAAASGQTGAA